MAKILIVDDDLETTKLFESIIKTSGHITSSVTESKDSISAIQAFQPNLILLDIMMANINGIAICKFIKADPDLKRIPVVMVSALSDDGTKRDAINAGADDFIVKPVIPSSFLAQIKSILDKA
jgi:DNA-binding response OmpR family regulator